MKRPTNTPTPPNPKAADHHWLEVFDGDDRSHGLIIAQWNPGCSRWSHSGCVGSGRYLETKNWRYVAPCPLPDEKPKPNCNSLAEQGKRLEALGKALQDPQANITDLVTLAQPLGLHLEFHLSASGEVTQPTEDYQFAG